MATHYPITPPPEHAVPLVSGGGSSRRSLAGAFGATLLLTCTQATLTRAAGPNPDAQLLADFATIQEIDRRSDELYEVCSEHLLRHPSWIPYNSHTAATMPTWHAAVARMVSAEARTVEGICAKALVAWRLLDIEENGAAPEEAPEGLAWSICRDLLEGRARA